MIKQVAAVSILSLALGSAQAGLVIDHFTDYQLVRDQPLAGESSSSQVIGGAFVGSSRDMTVNLNEPRAASTPRATRRPTPRSW